MTDRMLWPIVAAVLGFLYAFYDFAAGRTGEVCLAFIISTSICLVGLFWHYPRLAGVEVYELSVLALSLGDFMGSHPELYRSLLFAWMIIASMGGAILCIPRSSKPRPSTAWRSLRIGCVLAVVFQVGLAVAGFAQLLLIEKRPRASFRVLGNPLLQSLAFSSDGNRLATVGGFGSQLTTAKLWDAGTGGKLAEIVDTNVTDDPKLARLHFIDDHLALAIRADGHSSIAVLDVSKRETKARFEWADEACGGAATFSHDGGQFVYGNFEGHVRVFDLSAGKLTVDLNRRGGQVNCLAVSRANDKVACAAQANAIEVWRLSDSRQITALCSGANVECIDFSADGRLVACGTDAATVEVFDVAEECRIITTRCFCNGIVSSIAFSPNGEILACGGSRGVTILIDPESGEARGKLRMWGGSEVRCISFSTDGKRLATGNLRGDIAVWQLD